MQKKIIEAMQIIKRTKLKQKKANKSNGPKLLSAMILKVEFQIATKVYNYLCDSFNQVDL